MPIEPRGTIVYERVQWAKEKSLMMKKRVEVMIREF